jgi:hypothetical protein
MRAVRRDASGGLREYAVESCVLADPPGADGTSAAYVVAWTHGVATPHAQPTRVRTAPSTAP